MARTIEEPRIPPMGGEMIVGANSTVQHVKAMEEVAAERAEALQKLTDARDSVFTLQQVRKSRFGAR